MQLIVIASIAGAVACLGFVLWYRYAMRSLVVHEKKELAYNALESRVNRESEARYSLERSFGDVVLKVGSHSNKLTDLILTIDAYRAKHEGLRTEAERHIEELRALVDAIQNRPEDPEFAKAVAELNARCDKNSQAITNTAESMQKLLNEKFTALKLALTGK